MVNALSLRVKEIYLKLKSRKFPCTHNAYYPILATLFYLLLFPYISKWLVQKSFLTKLLFSPQMFFLIALIPAVIFMRVKISDLGIFKENLGKNIMLGLKVSLIPCIAIILFAIIPLTLYQIIKYGNVTLFNNMGNYTYAVHSSYLLQLLLLAPVSEELFFRGLLIPPVRKKMPLLPTVLICSLVFTFAHGYFKFGAFLLGLFSSSLFIYSGSLIPGVVFHFISNLWGPVLIAIFPQIYKTIFFLFK